MISLSKLKPIEISIAGFTFETTLSWQFFPYGNFILAKRDSNIGIFKFGFLKNKDLNRVSPDQLLSQVKQTYINHKVGKPVSRKVKTDGNFQSGTESFSYENDTTRFFLKIWFKNTNKILFTACYGCRWNQYQEIPAEREIQECDRMLITMRLSKK